MELDIGHPLKEKRILERKERMERFLSNQAPPKTLETFKPSHIKAGYHAPRLHRNSNQASHLPLSSLSQNRVLRKLVLGRAMDPSRAFIKDVRRVVVKVMQQGTRIALYLQCRV
jgi:hypothetical protein